jgi:esterase/lipase
MNFDDALRRLALVVGLAATIPLRAGDLRSHPFPAADYSQAINLVARRQTADDRVADPIGRTVLLTHGARTARIDILLHGFTDSPNQFAELADSLYRGGDNVYVPRLPHHAERSGDARALAGLTAVELRQTADSAVDIATALGDTVVVVGLSVGGTMAAWMGQHRHEVRRVVLIAPAFEAARVPSRLEGFLINLTERLPNVTRQSAPDTARPDRNPGFATHALAEVLRLGKAVQKAAQRKPPKAAEFTFLLNDRDRTVKTSAAMRLANDWEAHGARVSVYAFPASLGLPHNVLDGREPSGQPQLVLPSVIALSHGEPAREPLQRRPLHFTAKDPS